MIQDDLINFVKVLDKYNIEYALGGSGLMYSLNLIDVVNDWDITTDCPQEKLISALEYFKWEHRPSGDYPFASQYRISISNCNIDVIGCFAIYSDKKICNLPTIISSSWNGIKVGSPEVWFVAYTLLGRNAKAKLIYNYLESNGVNEKVIEKLNSHDSLPNEIKLSFLSLLKK